MLNNEIHEEYMKKILSNIFTSEIWQFLAFKWWTLAYLKYNLDRFSTDIDLDLLDINKETLVISKIREILVMFGDIKNETLGKTIHRWIFRYDEKSMNIKIEINKRIWTYNTYKNQKIADNDILCMTKDCLFTNKLVALSERFYPRDLYDINYFFKKWFKIKEELIKERTWLTTKELLKKLIKEIKIRFNENNILIWLWEVIDDKQKNLVKKILIKETIEQIQQFSK